MATQTNSIVPFLFEGDGLVRVIARDGDSWFVAADVARLLGYRDAEKALRLVAIDEKDTLQKGTLGLNQDLSLVSESGLYLLIFRSRKPKAVKFRRWVTGEVLPSIRKTGGYGARPRRGLTEGERAVRADLAVRRARVNEMHAATRALDVIRRSSGNRIAARACPGIFAKLGIVIDLTGSDTLAQGELPLAEIAETVH